MEISSGDRFVVAGSSRLKPATTNRQLQPAEAGCQEQPAKPDAEVERACRDMEALFVKQLLSEMRRAGGSMMKGGHGAEIYQELFDQELSQELSRSSDLGVARMLRRELGRSAEPVQLKQAAEPAEA